MTNQAPKIIDPFGRFDWESEVFNGQLTAGVEYEFNENQLTSLAEDDDGDTLYLKTREIRDFSINDPITGENPVFGEGFALGYYANEDVYAFASEGVIGNRNFTFDLKEASSDTFNPYSVQEITDGIDSVYINALPNNSAGTLTINPGELIQENQAPKIIDPFGRFDWESEVFNGQLTAGVEYEFNENQLTSLAEDDDGDTLYLKTREIRDFSINDPITGENPVFGEGFALGYYANEDVYAFASEGVIGNRNFTFDLKEASSDTFTPYSAQEITDGIDSVYINALPNNFAGTISVDSDEPGESPTPISVTPPSSSPNPSPVSSPIPSPETTPLPTPDSNQQNDDFTQLSDAGESLTGQSDIKLRMLGGNDFLEVNGGNNYANGNIGEDTIILRGGFGEYLGGKESDTIEVFDAEEGTSVNGNRGEDFITGTVASVIYRGGKDNDLLAVSQGDVWGDKGADTFRGVSSDGYAVIQDYTTGEDFVEIETEGSWSNVGDGLMFTDNSGDQLMLLLGINDVEQVSRV